MGKGHKVRLIAVVVGVLLVGKGFAQEDSVRFYQTGRALFMTNCSPCHGVHKEKTGPMLASITRKRSVTWLTSFIRDSQAVIVSGDQYAEFLFRQYNHQVMPAFTQLSDDEIGNILHYIEAESIEPTEVFAYAEDIRESGTPQVIKGRAIFNAQCASCHSIGKEDFGPALGSVGKRLPLTWLIPFIQNAPSIIESGDPYATDLYNAFDKKLMVPMEFLSRDDVLAVLDYISFASASPHYVAGVNGRNVASPSGTPRLATVSLYNVHPEQRAFGIFMIVLTFIGACIHGFIIVRLFRYLNKGQRS